MNKPPTRVPLESGPDREPSLAKRPVEDPSREDRLRSALSAPEEVSRRTVEIALRHEPRRHRRAARVTAIAVVVAMLAGGIGLSSFLRSEPPRELSRAEQGSGSASVVSGSESEIRIVSVGGVVTVSTPQRLAILQSGSSSRNERGPSYLLLARGMP